MSATDFATAEGLRLLLVRLHYSGPGAWKHDDEAAELLRFASHKYGALARKHGLVTRIDKLVEDMARLLDAPCTFEDAEFRLIGFSDQGGVDEVDTIRQRSILERGSSTEVRAWFHAQGIRESLGPIRTPNDASRGIVGRLCIPASHRGRVHGYFWLLDPEGKIDEELWPEATRIAESAAALLNLVELRQDHRDALFRELIEGNMRAARQSATELAAAGALGVHQPVACVLVQRPEPAQELASRATRQGLVWVRTSPEVCAAVVAAKLLPPSTDIFAVLGSLGLNRRITDLDNSTRVGIGPVVGGLDRLAAAHAGALVALRVASRLGNGTVVDWNSLGPLSLLGVARDDDLAWALIPPRMKLFLERAEPDLVETARVYLNEAGSASRTADRLAVHRQSVYHRLAKIERQLECDLSKGEDRLRLHLAIRLAPFVLRRESER